MRKHGVSKDGGQHMDSRPILRDAALRLLRMRSSRCASRRCSDWEKPLRRRQRRAAAHAGHASSGASPVISPITFDRLADRIDAGRRAG